MQANAKAKAGPIVLSQQKHLKRAWPFSLPSPPCLAALCKKNAKGLARAAGYARSLYCTFYSLLS